MAESNIPTYSSSILVRLAETQRDSIQRVLSKNLIIVVHDDDDQLKGFRQIATAKPECIGKMHVFDDDEQCSNFVCEKVAEDPNVKFIVFVGGRLVRDLVSSIHFCSQVKTIFILNKPPFDEEERELMKTCPKVTYVADMQPKKTESDEGRLSAIESTEVTRFNDSVDVKLVYGKESYDEIPSEPAERSLKTFDTDFVFRYIMLMCLVDAPSFPSDKDDLIELFERETFASPADIEKFKEKYSPTEALFFYTRDAFIYRNLNTALRTKKISHLLPFRFVLQNIYERLHEQMTQETSDQVLTVYRSQQSSEFEIADLILAYEQHSPVMITSFFSTSKNQNIPLSFLDYTRPGDMTYYQILFTITARKQDASRYFPFADISKLSVHPEEEEVLFVPGQMFEINNIEITFKGTTRIHLITMSMNSGFDKQFTAVHEEFQNLLKRHMNDSLVCFAQFLVQYERFDDAKQLYGQLLSQNADKNKKYACYEGLFCIANGQNDTSEATIMHQKMTETKFGTEHLTTNASDILLTKVEHNEFQTDLNQIMNLNSLMSLDWLVKESSADVQSDDYRNSLQQTTKLAYKFATMMMKNGKYTLAIQLFEGSLPMMELQDTAGFDPLLKAKYYMQLGHCYRELKFDTTALENYKLSLEQNIHLPLDEYIETLIGLGAVLEATNDYKDALYRYIEIAEIYQDNSTIGGLEERHHIEECIQRVTSHLISVD